MGVQGEFCPGHAVRVGVRGEFCTGSGAVLLVLGEFCPGHAVKAGVQGEFCTEAARRGCWRAIAAPWRCSRASRPGFPCPGRSPCRWRWGFCTTRSLLAACRRRVGPPCSAIPPIGDGEAASRGGVVATVQTHWAKRDQNRRLWLNGSAFWRIRCLSWFVGCT